MEAKKGIYPIKGVVQHYDWGGTEYIPGLLGIINTSKKPFAEYWLGTHPKSPSVLISEPQSPGLDRLADLPFLFKVLDVNDMLSIQVHPSREAAAIGYARENSERIPLDSPKRNYKDENHKPELAYAISEFWLLHGFKEPEKIERILMAVPEFAGLHALYQHQGYEGLYKKVMGMPQEEVQTILQPVLDRILPLYELGALHKQEEDYWAAKAAITFNKEGWIDRGIFSIYFFNIVKLEPGETIFQDAGIPHAYLFGQCVEIMANSDNVLRGGLTTKHIDVKELMKHVQCRGIIPQLSKGRLTSAGERIFDTPAPDFQLSEIEMAGTGSLYKNESAVPEILLALSGSVEINAGDIFFKLEKGQAAFIQSGISYELRSNLAARIFKASTPPSTAGE